MKANKRWKFKRAIMSFVDTLGNVFLILDIFIVGFLFGCKAMEAKNK